MHGAKLQRFQRLILKARHNFQKRTFNYKFGRIHHTMKKGLTLLILGVFVLSVSSCSLFRKKNKCMSCPTWKDEVELESDIKDKTPEETNNAQRRTAE